MTIIFHFLFLSFVLRCRWVDTFLAYTGDNMFSSEDWPVYSRPTHIHMSITKYGQILMAIIIFPSLFRCVHISIFFPFLIIFYLCHLSDLVSSTTILARKKTSKLEGITVKMNTIWKSKMNKKATTFLETETVLFYR